MIVGDILFLIGFGIFFIIGEAKSQKRREEIKRLEAISFPKAQQHGYHIEESSPNVFFTEYSVEDGCMKDYSYEQWQEHEEERVRKEEEEEIFWDDEKQCFTDEFKR